MPYLENEIPLIVDSKFGDNRSADGSSFTVRYGDGGPLQLPRTAVNPTIEVQSASVWWSVSNIEEKVNDKIYITGPSALDSPQLYVVTIPQGLYDILQLQAAIARELTNLGAKSDPPLITLSPDEATNKVELTLNYANTSVDFTQADTFRDILGFNSSVIGPNVAGFVQLAPNVAKFNTIEYFLINSDIVPFGIPFNNVHQRIIAQVHIDVEVGSQIVYKPFNPTRIPLSGNIGMTNIRFWLTDNNNKLVNTNSETWSARLVIRYYDWVDDVR